MATEQCQTELIDGDIKDDESEHANLEYPMYDLNENTDRKLFAYSLIKHSFALIKIPNNYKSSLNDLFSIFKQLFTSTKQSKRTNLKFIGYLFNLNKQNDKLFPSIDSQIDHKSVLNESSNNYQKVINAYKNYNKIASDAIHTTLEHICKDKQSYIKCYNHLFPNNTDKDRNNDYPESSAYHKHRKQYDLHLNNLGVMHYFGDDKLKNEEKTDDNDDPFGLHVDYTLITLLIANKSGLTVFDKVTKKFVEIGNRENVIVVITGLTMALLTDSDINPEIGISLPMACQHKVLKRYTTDRLSFPLFCYADPNGIVDTSLIANTTNHIKVEIAAYLAKEETSMLDFDA